MREKEGCCFKLPVRGRKGPLIGVQKAPGTWTVGRGELLMGGQGGERVATWTGDRHVAGKDRGEGIPEPNGLFQQSF